MAMPAVSQNIIPEAVYWSVHLQKPAEHIRLLKVDSVADKSVVCSMTVVSLRAELTFTALSYAWRDALYKTAGGAPQMDRSAFIVCNGERCRVLENLHEALLQLGTKPDQYLWIDALCINQQDPEEKTIQVQLMSTIYQFATRVSIWLGKHDADTDNAIRLINHLELLQPDELAAMNIYTLGTSTVVALLSNEYHQQKFWVSLARLFRRTWFTRAWVVQEVILANPAAILVHCGEHTIAWRTMRRISDYLSRSSWKDTFCNASFLGDTLQVPRIGAAAKIGGTQDDIEKMTKASFSGEPHDLFLDTLIRVREFDCQYRRDKVYCCYGVGTRYRPRDFPFPKPDYSRGTTDAEAFTQTGRAVLQMSQSLHLLAYAESLRSPDLEGKETMPSWVPDWSVPEKVGLGVTGYRRYWSAGNLTQIVEFADHPANRVLQLRAAQVDKVADLGNSKDEISYGEDLEATMRILRLIRSDYRVGVPAKHQSREEVLWRTLVGDTCPRSRCPALASVGEQFRPWLRGRRGHACEKLIHLLDALDRPDFDGTPSGKIPNVPETTNAPTAPQTSDFGDNYALRTCLKLFRTATGLLGLGAEAVGRGDSVWIVPGSRVPLLMRRSTTQQGNVSNQYQLVGAAYVHGLMHGEALEWSPAIHFQQRIQVV